MISRDIGCFRILSIGFFSLFVFYSFFGSLLPLVAGQDTAGYDLATDLIMSRYSNLTPVFKDEIQKKFGFCIVDIDEDWNEAFNFSKDSRFIANCGKKMSGGSIGEVMAHLCTAAEMKIYAGGLLEIQKATYLKPNKNCNLSSWVSGCDLGGLVPARRKLT